MEQTCVDTSLNLNVIPSRHIDLAVLVEELHRLSSENKRLTETLNKVCESYDALQRHLSHLKDKDIEKEGTPLHKRKVESEINCMNMFGISSFTECSTITEDETFKRPRNNNNNLPKVSKVLVRTEASDTSLYVRDGYQWRKYGQKVTRDNPFPRAYFKCSCAPSCPVKKKVQKSLEDQTILVATYEGEHNHDNDQAEISLSSTSHGEKHAGLVPISSAMVSTTNPTVTLDLVQSTIIDNAQKSSIQKLLIQQMATSLTRDPNFTAALATAISGRILEHTNSME
ncbi:PREDICTED: probable WRKY transcription factor 40 isoform X1 [Lupinus angustifolius]|uniref:probable WRKY transcription factor 40 isoform X1 n=1 Tax=Lupinus angustifolius TaxID=3871 RepID=UPI00092E71BE|nr:PREDICTED: probable WRKY transcription factor 40 isoform X1 [Lupinus angustifolius]